MNRSVLLVSTATRWLGTARMPRILAKAGFEVALLAPRDSLGVKSRYVARTGFLSDTATPMEWLMSFVALVAQLSPRFVIPCDEMAVRLLFTVVLEPPAGLSAEMRSRLGVLIRESVGDPAFYLTSIDKTLLPAAAEALGVRVPAFTVATRVADAEAFAEDRGYPIVLKRRFGFAGQGVAIVADRHELGRAFTRLVVPDQLDLGAENVPSVLAQSFVRGAHYSEAMVSWEGVRLAGFTWERYHATAPVKGQTAALRFVRSAECEGFSETLCRGFGINGFSNLQYLIDAETGRAHLLEVNRRIVTHTHMGERVGVDLATALFDRLADRQQSIPHHPTDLANRIVTVFPREWLFDPDSPFLRDFPVDAPWDDPQLLEAMFAMRHET